MHSFEFCTGTPPEPPNVAVDAMVEHLGRRAEQIVLDHHLVVPVVQPDIVGRLGVGPACRVHVLGKRWVNRSEARQSEAGRCSCSSDTCWPVLGKDTTDAFPAGMFAVDVPVARAGRVSASGTSRGRGSTRSAPRMARIRTTLGISMLAMGDGRVAIRPAGALRRLTYRTLAVVPVPVGDGDGLLVVGVRADRGCRGFPCRLAGVASGQTRRRRRGRMR